MPECSPEKNIPAEDTVWAKTLRPGTTSMCLRKVRVAAARVKRRLRCEGTKRRPIKQSPADNRKESGFNFNAGEATGEATEYSG